MYVKSLITSVKKMPNVRIRAGIFLLLLATLGFVYGYQYLRVSMVKQNWEMISREEEQSFAKDIRSRFQSYCTETDLKVKEIVEGNLLSEVLTNYSDSLRTELFTYLLSRSTSDITVEVYDREKRLVGWVGPRGKETDTSKLVLGQNVYIREGAIYSYLVVSKPIVRRDSLLGYVVGKRLFDVNYPLNNRFINATSFASSFTPMLDVEYDITYSADSSKRTDPDFFATPLSYPDQRIIIFALAPQQTLSMYIDHVESQVRSIRNIIILLIVLMLCYQTVRVLLRQSSSVKIIGMCLTVWLLRYTILWFDIPQSICQMPIFEPGYFASPFGFGIARSLGDLVLSSIFLLSTVFFIARNMNLQDDDGRKNTILKTAMLKNILIVILCFGLTLLAIRSFAAIIRSTVYDSTILYVNPVSLLPSPELFMMLFSLFCIALSFVLGTVGLLNIMKNRLDSILSLHGKTFLLWLILGGILVAGSIVYGLLFTNTLLSQLSRLVIIILLLAILFLSKIFNRGAQPLERYRILFMSIIGAILIVVPILTTYVHEYDRSRIEFTSTDILRPENTWLSFLVNASLDACSTPGVGKLLADGENADIEKLAFVEWARSILSREGNNCTIIYYDRYGRKISDFHLGSTATKTHDTLVIPIERITYLEETNLNGTAVKWYSGTQPIYDDERNLVGAIQIQLTGSRETFIRGEMPEILRTSNFPKREISQYKLIFTEYTDGRIAHSTSQEIPLNRKLPDKVTGNNERSGLWIDEEIDGKKYESYFFRESASQDSGIWYALSREVSDVPIYSFMLLQCYFLYFILTISMFIVAIAIRRGFGHRYRFDFRSRLTIAFSVLSILPIIFIAYYNQQYSIERTRKSTTDRLKEQTSVVASEIDKGIGVTVPTVLAAATDEQCMTVADDINIDFNLYFLTGIQASSKPEMYKAELIDSNLSANAYLNLFLQKRNFYAEQQTIGDLTYVVGYRPIIAQNGVVIGAIAVPSLYRLPELIERLTQRNVYLYVVYAVSLLLSILVGTFFAKRISAPIKRLKAATIEIADGKLDISLENDRMDELGDLERAFKQMAQNLQSARDELVKAQKEVAWREMAKQVAHEIKNPLTPIRLSVQHLRQAYKDGVKNFDELLHQITSTILEQIEVLNRIATEFSHYAKMPKKEHDVIDIHQVLIEAINLFKQYQRIELKIQFEATSTNVLGDGEEFRRAVINVIRNSVQALKERGVIIISTGNVEDRIEIIVTDNGPGISDEVQQHLFEPNFSTKTDGMGLGLAIVKKIIDEMGGEISIQSVEHRGTTVKIILPLSSK